MSTRMSVRSRRTSAWMLAGLTALLLAACGGGGDDGPPIADVEFPVAAGVSTYVLSAHQYDLKGTLDGVEFTMHYTYTPEVPAVFEGQPASAALQAMTLSAAGMSEQTTVRAYFNASPYRPFGSTDLTDGGYAVFSLVADLPARARVGDAGPFGTERDYADASKTQLLGTADVSWSLEADTATTALFCINVAYAAAPDVSGSECYRVDAAGQVLGMVIKVQVLGKTLVLR